jgi:hypothetical protein
VAAKYWHKKNIGSDKILVLKDVLALTEIIGVDKNLA